MNWLTFALAAVAINTALGLGLRVLTKDTTNPRITGFVYNCYAALASAIIWIANGAELPHNVPLFAIALLLFSAVGYGVFQRGQFYLRKHVEVSQLQPVMQSGLVAGFAASIIILGEPLTGKKFLGTLIILGGVLLINLDKKLNVNKYAFFAIAISSALSVAGVVDKVASPHFPLFFYAMMIWILPLAYIAIPVKRTEITTAVRGGTWRIPLLASLNALSLVFLVRALQLGEASSVIPVMATVSVATVLGGVVILKERKDWPIKLLAGLLVTLGIIILH